MVVWRLTSTVRSGPQCFPSSMGLEELERASEVVTSWRVREKIHSDTKSNFPQLELTQMLKFPTQVKHKKKQT
ncbi:hypothetical protein E2C01_030393 [Portunus trituberculatus]|uniref:Uncharacterized protein n=1 Tax=Portunus trituberculatus TaxID=210409 RepID=A0A5B7EU55_PORTR|nr:hypothetical protein [Portunus trituberculatus]